MHDAIPDRCFLQIEDGVSCARCHAVTSDTQKAGVRERKRQWGLAKARGLDWVGAGGRTVTQ